MSREMKKLRKEYRKYIDQGGCLELFRLIIKPKPRWVPYLLWLWGIKLFINVDEDMKKATKEVQDAPAS